MRERVYSIVRGFAVLLFLSGNPASAGDDLVDLLQLPGAQPVTDVAVAGGSDVFPALLDADPASIARMSVVDGAPTDSVFDFGKITTPLRLTLSLPASEGEPRPTRADILVSSTSPVSGFRSVRNEPIDGLTDQVIFDLPPQAARWLMLRLYPAPGAATMTVGDLLIEGQTGLPETTYAFGESPTSAITILNGLVSLDTAGFELSAEEAAIFEKASAGPLSTADFETAVLLASGVTGMDRLAHYRAMLDDLERKARAELPLQASPAELGEALLRWLHTAALTKGYVSQQTDLSVLLEEGTFNCVSSAVLYAILGRRVGLDVRGIEVPDHAFAIVYAGVDHMDVETTTPGGFNPQRNRVAEFEALTGFSYIPESHRDKRREIDGAGLAALIFYNHGVEMLKEGRFRESILANFRAMSLDPDFTSAATNALAGLGRWSEELATAGRWQEAASVAALGVRLAPDDVGLEQRQLSIWQGWAMSMAAAGQPQEAIELLALAPKAIAASDLARIEAAIFLAPAEDLAAAGQWTSALQEVDVGRTLLTGAAKEEIENWRRSLYVRWANTAIDGLRYDEAADILARALADDPQSDTFRKMVRYLAQEQAAAAPDYASGLAMLRALRVRFPDIPDWDDVVGAFVIRTIQAVLATQGLEEALALADAAMPELSVSNQADLVAQVFELHGHAAIDRADWALAASIYAAGLARIPENALLDRNARFVVQEWQRAAFANGGVAALGETNELLRALFPQFGDATGSSEVQRRVTELLAAGAFDEAVALLESAQLLLVPDEYEDLSTAIVDRRARAAFDVGDFASAADHYRLGLIQWPDSALLANNATYLAQEWLRAAEANGGTEAVLAARASLRVTFPENEDIGEVTLATLHRSIDARIKEGAFAEARGILAVARPSLAERDVAALATALFSGLARDRVKAVDWAGAADALAEGLRLVPGADDLERNAAFVTQEWAAATLAENDPVGFVEVATVTRRAFPGLGSIDDVLEAVVGRAVQEMLDAHKETEAVDLLRDLDTGLTTQSAIRLTEYAYDHWARRLGEAGNWSAAVEIYDQGLAELPDSSLLANNRDYAASKD